MKTFDTIIVGAGAAGLMAAGSLAQRKKSVLIIDMGDSPARKVAISGGGRCNFTNLHADYSRYFGKNPRFVISALHQFSPRDMLNWVKKHSIKYVEKEPGRYFCKNDASEIVNALINDTGNTKTQFNTTVVDIDKTDNGFIVKTNHGDFGANSVIIATGGVSYPHLNVSNIAHKIAKKFGHKIEPVHPALCAIKTNEFNSELAGISLPVSITINKHKINDDLLFTHFGIGGPAAYRATLFDINKMEINFAPNTDVFEKLKNAKQTNGRKTLVGVLGEILPNKLARFFTKNDMRNIADFRDNELKAFAQSIQCFNITHAKTIGLQSAEVTYGGISTDKISSKTMESMLCPGLYFVGESMDITGDLGGFNLQWAFSSGIVAGNNA
jgi:hypothetical protein